MYCTLALFPTEIKLYNWLWMWHQDWCLNMQETASIMHSYPFLCNSIVLRKVCMWVLWLYVKGQPLVFGEELQDVGWNDMHAWRLLFICCWSIIACAEFMYWILEFLTSLSWTFLCLIFFSHLWWRCGFRRSIPMHCGSQRQIRCVFLLIGLYSGSLIHWSKGSMNESLISSHRQRTCIQHPP